MPNRHGSWTCPICTLVNPDQKRRCNACKSRKPVLEKENREPPRLPESSPVLGTVNPSPSKPATKPATTRTATSTRTRKRTRASLSVAANAATVEGQAVGDVGIPKFPSRNIDSSDGQRSKAKLRKASKSATATAATSTTNDTIPKSTRRRKRKIKNTTMEDSPEDTKKSTIPSENPTPESKALEETSSPAGAASKAIYRHVVDGWQDTHSSENLTYVDGVDVEEGIHPVVNPATNRPSLYYQETSEEALENAIKQATLIQDSFYQPSGGSKDTASIVQESSWWSDPHQHHRRASVLTKIAEVLGKNIDRLADLEVLQIGRPRKEMRFQLARLPEWFLYFASLLRVSGSGLGGDAAPPFGGSLHCNVVTRVPLGVVAQITPFNHPLLIAVKKLAPALAAGNCVVLKPSEQAPASVIELALICKEAGLPEGVLSVVLGRKRVGELLVSHPSIRRVDFTGGPLAGSAIGAAAGKNVCGMTQELGGKAPMLVFAPKGIRSSDSTNEAMDAYLDPIVNGCAFGAFIASGQTCIAGTRLLVQREIYSTVCDKLAHKVQSVLLKEGMGDPFDMATTFGPMINTKQMEFVDSVVKSCNESDDQGENHLQLLCGGKRYLGFEGDEAHLNEGNWYEPTLIAFQSSDESISEEDHKALVSKVHHTSPLFQKELFGPVLGILPFEDEDHAIELANDSPFSLGCSIWTHDLVQAHSVANKVRAGITWINDHHKNAPASPWGGLTKDSGIGRENGTEALMEYSQAKSLVIRTQPYADDWFKDPNARYN